MLHITLSEQLEYSMNSSAKKNMFSNDSYFME